MLAPRRFAVRGIKVLVFADAQAACQAGAERLIAAIECAAGAGLGRARIIHGRDTQTSVCSPRRKAPRRLAIISRCLDL